MLGSDRKTKDKESERVSGRWGMNYKGSRERRMYSEGRNGKKSSVKERTRGERGGEERETEEKTQDETRRDMKREYIRTKELGEKTKWREKD